jgi:TctA family transporter
LNLLILGEVERVDAFSNLLQGLQIALQARNCLCCFVGVFIGTLIGVLLGWVPC